MAKRRDQSDDPVLPEESDTTASQASAQDAAVVDALLSTTGAHEGVAATVLDRDAQGPTGPGATILDEAGRKIGQSGGRIGARVRVNLPEQLAERFETIDTITRGAEADLLVVRDRSSQELRVIKLYRQSAGRIDRKTLEMLEHADPEHVVRIYAYDEWDGEWWEEMEYCQLGSLAELISKESGPKGLPDRLVREIVDEIINALEHLHTLPSDGKPLVHRDLKPANILVRERQPRLDLIIADFGLARVINASRDMRSRSRTVEYAAPEASWGEVSPARDWWSLGIMIVELATGRHPFCHEDGTPMEQAAIEAHLQRRPIDVSGITDSDPKLPDLRLLARGLLVIDAQHRWGIEQIREWRLGKHPPVHESRFTRAKSTIAFVSGGQEFNDPVALAEAWSQDWDRAAEIVFGSSEHRRERIALRDFLRSCDFAAEDLARLEAILTTQDESSHRRLTELLRQLDPSLPPIYRGTMIDRAGLSALAAKAAAGDKSAQAIISTLYTDEVLRLHGHLEGCEGFATVEQHWHDESETLSERLRAITADLPGQEDDTLHQLMLAARAIMLVALLEHGDRSVLHRQLAEAYADSDALEVDAYAQLAATKQPAPANVAALLAGRPAAHQIGSAIRKQREKEEHERRARQRAELGLMVWRAIARALMVTLLMSASVVGVAVALSFSGGVPEPAEIVMKALWPSLVIAASVCVGACVTHELMASRSERLSYMGSTGQFGRLYIPSFLAAGLVVAAQLPSGSGVVPLQNWPLVPTAFATVFLIVLAVRAAEPRNRPWLARLRAMEPRLFLVAAAVTIGAVGILVVALADKAAIGTEETQWHTRSAALASVSRPACTPVAFNAESPYLSTVQAQTSCAVLGSPVLVSWFRNHAGLAAYNNSIVRPTRTIGLCKSGHTQISTLTMPGTHALLGRFYCYFDAGPHAEWTYDPVNALVRASPSHGGLDRAYQVYRHFHLNYGALSQTPAAG
jgi:serine/threonine protein kinase